MFDAKLRRELDTLQLRMRDWKGNMPERAARFHAVCADLDNHIRGLLERRLPFWISADEVEGLRQRVNQLAGIADSLAALARQADKLAQELGDLERRLEPETELAWLKDRCRDWSIAVRRLAGACERQSDLFDDEDALDRIQGEVRRHEEALHWLKEARGVLERLGSNLDTARLEADLPPLTRRLEQEGASQDWLAEIQALVQPLQALAQQPPPPGLQRVGSMLTELRGWARELGELQREVGELERRHRLVDTEWRSRGQDEIQELEQEAGRLHDALLEQARAARAAKVQTLEALMLDLFRACGHQPEMAERLEVLKQGAVSRPHLQKDWMTRFGEVSEYFKAIASTHVMDLEKQHETLAGELKGGLEVLRDKPLSDPIRRQADELELELERLDRLQGVEGLLRDLRRLGELQTWLQDLDSQARKDIEDLFQAQQALGERNAAVQREAARIGVESEDLAALVEDLGKGSDERTLEQARDSAEELAQRLTGLERRLVASSQALLTERAGDVEAACQALRQAGRSTPAPPSAVIADDSDLHQAVEAVAACERLHRQLMDQVDQAIDERDQQRLRLAAELEVIDAGDLGPADRQDAGHLARELDRGAWSATEDPLERLTRLSLLVEQGEYFLERLFQEQRLARERLDRLRGRLRRFKDEQLEGFCPADLVQRVTDLIYGIPDEPRRWSAVQHQLDQAEMLLGRLETQARRQTARQMDERVTALRDWLGRNADTGSAAAVRTLLIEVEQLGAEKPVPVLLRTRLDRTVLQLH